MRGPESATELGPASFVPTPVKSAGHARTFEETWASLIPVLPRVPVTRVYDASPLDILGIPVWCAVTPLARDLTVHAGKGGSPLAARISAVMEAIERVCAESIAPQRCWHGSYRELAARTGDGAVIWPGSFPLPFETSWHEDLGIWWTGCYDLMTESHHWVPVSLVISPAADGVLAGVATNGLASGNTYPEAVLHALHEVVERDAVAQEEFYLIHHDQEHSPSRPVRLIDPGTLPDDSRMLVGRIAAAGLRVQVQDCGTDTGIPVFGAVIVDEDYPGAEGEALTFAGYGADLDPARAVFRALTESAQSHTGVVLGARDEFEGMRPVPLRPAMLRRRAEILYGDARLPFPVGAGGGRDLTANIQEVLRRLRACGISRCLVTELTRHDLGVPVVRVLIPGLAGPYPDSAQAPVLRLLSVVV
jgi:YcaO-like protein with predicted kinase domain